jgi:DNA-binding LacI/PurR family transcriptional regulator
MSTIYDVARLAKVSPKTAARILAGEEGRPANRARVLAAAQTVGYVRNQQAASLRSGKSNLLGLIVPDIQNPHYPAFFQMIHDVALAHGYHVLLSSTFGKASEAVRSLRMFQQNRVEGIIADAAEGESDEACDPLFSEFLEKGVPIILCGRPARDVAADVSRIKNVAAVSRAVAYLRSKGHRRIGCISGESMAGRERRTGFLKGMAAGGLSVDPSLILLGSFTIEGGLVLGRELLRAKRRPTAIVTANDLMAIGVMQAAREQGLRTPEDVAVLGFGDSLLTQFITPGLTTLRMPVERIAEDCVKKLLQRLSGRDVSSPVRMEYDAELVIRESA